MKRTCSTAIVLIACSLSGCAATSKGQTTASSAGATPAGAFTIRTTPTGASVETTQPYRCTTPCQVPLRSAAFVATVTLLGYKPVQIPVAAATNPGLVDIKLEPQDPGAGAPSPTAAK